MPDYKEQTIEGKSWMRAFHVDAQNPIEGAKGITYHEETAILIGGKVITSRNGQRLQCPYDGSDILIIDPNAGKATRSTLNGGQPLVGNNKWVGGGATDVEGNIIFHH